MVMSWLYHGLARDLADSVVYVKTAHDLWLDLEDRFSQRNGPRIYEIKRFIAMLQ